uniref:Uncharacterized protein n=1 Tax=Chenopodium quinoa TaxID=63459 RepID=A0A803KT40_CHEQI
MPGGPEDGTVIPSFGGHVAAYIWGGQERNVLRCLSRTQLCTELVTWRGRLAQEHLELIDGSVLSAAQTLLAALQCSELQEILSIFGYKSQLDDLRRTVSAVNAVLLDAEAKQELSHEAQYKLEELRDAVFEADDLLDEFVTLAQQKQLLEAGGSLSKKFSFKHDPEPIRRRRPETCSYVDAGDIIGRRDDLEKIVPMMLDSNVQHDVSFLTIVGIGGLGKTALAQLVYNDPRVTSAFPLRMWTCVSDQDQKQFDVKEILCKILASATGQSHEHTTMDQVQKQLRDQLADQKNLLVLDDVWSEKCDQWRDLERFLIGGQKGSWILVTTRSLATANFIGDGSTHQLQGLSEENSWCLFQRMAFGLQSSNPPDDLVKIGQEIVKGCARVPLAIRVVGSLLYGQDKSKWLSLAQIGFANLRDSQNGIMPILKLSYHNLESPLKSCFSYCALFPKDYRIEKEMLISLWMAQGYIVPLDEGQSIEDAAEEYFSILLLRCFFQDVERNESGDIVNFKIHDLMHDVAQTLTKQEILATDNLEGNLDDKVRHLSVTKNKIAKCLLLYNLKGSLFINLKWPKYAVKVDSSRTEGHCLRRKENLKHLRFHFYHQEVDIEEARKLMEALQPHSNLERLEVRGYQGVRMAGWATLLPNLVHTCLENCEKLEWEICGISNPSLFVVYLSWST